MNGRELEKLLGQMQKHMNNHSIWHLGHPKEGYEATRMYFHDDARYIHGEISNVVFEEEDKEIIVESDPENDNFEVITFYGEEEYHDYLDMDLDEFIEKLVVVREKSIPFWD